MFPGDDIRGNTSPTIPWVIELLHGGHQAVRWSSTSSTAVPKTAATSPQKTSSDAVVVQTGSVAEINTIPEDDEAEKTATAETSTTQPESKVGQGDGCSVHEE